MVHFSGDILSLNENDVFDAAVQLRYASAAVQKVQLMAYVRQSCQADCDFCPLGNPVVIPDGDERIPPTEGEIKSKIEIALQIGATLEIVDNQLAVNFKSIDPLIALVQSARAYECQVTMNPGICRSEQFMRRFKDAGIAAYVNNLETSSSLFTQHVQTHEQNSKLLSLELAKGFGIPIHTGFILGIGEDDQDIADMFQMVHELQPNLLNLNLFFKTHDLRSAFPLPDPDLMVKRLAQFRVKFPKMPICVGGDYARVLGQEGVQRVQSFISGYYHDDFLNLRYGNLPSIPVT